MKKIKTILASLMFFLLVSQSVFATAVHVKTAMNGNGDTAAVWQTYDITGFNLGIATLPFTGSWSGITVLGSPTFVELNPKVAYNTLGQIVVIWSTVDTVLGLNALYYTYFDGSVWVTTGTQISSNTENVYDNYNIELSQSLDWAVITWSSFDVGLFDNVVRAYYGQMGSLQGPVTVS